MKEFIDIVMAILFILFMVFIFGGYHKNKYGKREADEKRQKEKEESL